MRPITLAGFDAKFGDSDDPWQTFEGPDEVLKRKAIIHAMGSGPWGRVLELAAGNGSNSAGIAPRALRLDATEATESGTALVRKAVGCRRGGSRAGRTRVLRLAVPARLPRQRYDGVVVAELLYYLTPRAMGRTARDVARAIRPGGAGSCPSPDRLSRFRATCRHYPASLPRRNAAKVARANGSKNRPLGSYFLLARALRYLRSKAATDHGRTMRQPVMIRIRANRNGKLQPITAAMC